MEELDLEVTKLKDRIEKLEKEVESLQMKLESHLYLYRCKETR